MSITYPFGYFSLPGTRVAPGIEKKSSKVIVISSFGNTSIEANGVKSVPIEQMLGRNIFSRTMSKSDSDDSLTKIEGFFDERNRIIYLHLKGIFDATVYINACKNFKEEIKSKGFLVVWADWKFQYARALLLMFSLSHIMLFHHADHIFDVTYISLFKALDSIREQYIPYMEDILKDIPNVSRDWQENGRFCSPRVLFIFSASRIPRHIMREAIEEKQSGSKIDRARNHPIRKMELNLEYQIYRLLRSSRVITNICLNSLFALPSNQPFVYICEDHQEPAILSVLVKENMTDLCNESDPLVKNFQKMLLEANSTGAVGGTTEAETNLVLNRHRVDMITPLSNHSEADLLSASLLSSISTDKKLNLDHSFSIFIRQHIDEAFTKGFEDNVGRNAGIGYFEVPKVNTWLSVYKKMHDILIDSPDEGNKVTSSLRNTLNTDVRFSENRCSKAMVLAVAAYIRNLPAYYSQGLHDSKLAMSMSVLSTHARGPMYSKYAEELEKTCEDYWKDGRIGCQTISIMGNPCLQPMHRDGNDKDIDDSSLPIMDHDSEVLCTGYCNCGYTKIHLKDPFTDKAAFIDLYTHLKKDCCMELEEISFSTLNADLEDCTEPITFIGSSQEMETEQILESDEPRSVSACRDSPLIMTESSPDSQGDPKDILRSSDNSTDEQERSPTHSNSETIPVVPVSELMDVVKQLKPSAHDVTSAMLTIKSLEDFTPKYATWSLLCLGPSSLYSHNAGICDQPGFLSGTNFLLPWDVAVKIPDKNKWPAIAESMGKKGYILKNKKSKVGGKDTLVRKNMNNKVRVDLTEFNVKVFLGCEYQCLRGHRFMMADIDKYLKASSLGHVKDTATKIATSDMPLYYPCPCSRNGTVMNAQLMRLHVVTPKAPVNVTLNPIIQPSPSPNAQFIPQPLSNGPMELTPSTYWLLRLPFFYVDENEFYEPPDSDRQVDVNYGKLIKGCYGISDINLDR